ncbi:MAG: hypothetical protein C0514_02450 [Candidatus Puniceispirillum sp.]|nr:hypothetical protein [Candidatus Puniceispirillum sp.]
MHNNLFKTMLLATALVSVSAHGSSTDTPWPSLSSEALGGVFGSWTSPAQVSVPEDRSAVEILNLLQSGAPETRHMNPAYRVFLSAAHDRNVVFLEDGTLDPTTMHGIPAAMTLFGGNTETEPFARGVYGLFSWASRMAGQSDAPSADEPRNSPLRGVLRGQSRVSAIDVLHMLRNGAQETRSLNRAYAVFLSGAHNARIGVGADGSLDPATMLGISPLSLFGSDTPSEPFARGLRAVLTWASIMAEQPVSSVTPGALTPALSPELETEFSTPTAPAARTMETVLASLEGARGNLAQEQEHLARLQGERTTLRLRQQQESATVDERIRLARDEANAAGDAALAGLFEARLASLGRIDAALVLATRTGDAARAGDLVRQRADLYPLTMIASSSSDPAPRTLSQVEQDIAASRGAIDAFHAEIARLEEERGDLRMRAVLSAQGEEHLLRARLAGLTPDARDEISLIEARLQEIEGARVPQVVVPTPAEEVSPAVRETPYNPSDAEHESRMGASNCPTLEFVTALVDEAPAVSLASSAPVRTSLTLVQEVVPTQNQGLGAASAEVMQELVSPLSLEEQSGVSISSAPVAVTAPRTPTVGESSGAQVLIELASAGSYGAARVRSLNEQLDQMAEALCVERSSLTTPLGWLQAEVRVLQETVLQEQDAGRRAQVRAQIAQRQTMIQIILDSGASSKEKQVAALILDATKKTGNRGQIVLAQKKFDRIPN